MNNTDYNSDRIYYPIKNDVNYENNKWDTCNLRQENAKYGFQVMPKDLYLLEVALKLFQVVVNFQILKGNLIH